MVAHQTGRPVIFVGSWGDYGKLFALQADRRRFEPIFFVPSEEIRKNRLMRLFRGAASVLLYRRIIERQFGKYPEGVFLFGERIEGLHYLARFRPTSDVAVVLRNPMSDQMHLLEPLRAVVAAGYPVLSFDREDCERYGFRFYPQYVAPILPLPLAPPVADFSFLGQDKGRRPVVEDLRDRLAAKGFTASIRFAGGHGKKRGFFDKLMRKDMKKGKLSYEGYLREILSARCVIDIVQKGQHGLTLRPLEAMIYGRKLLTSSRSVREERLFHPDNVFVLDEAGSIDGIEAFMAAPMAEVSEETKAYYSVDTLIETAIAACAGTALK